MKKYLVSLIGLSCIISTMQLQTSQQPPRQGLSPEQVYKDLSPVQQRTSPFTTKLTFTPKRLIPVEEAPITVDNRPLVSTTQRLSVSPAQLQNGIQDLVADYFWRGTQDPNIIADLTFKDILRLYRIDESAKRNIQDIIENEINQIPGINHSNTPQAISGHRFHKLRPTQAELRSFIQTKIKNHYPHMQDRTALYNFIRKYINETYEMSGQPAMTSFALSELNNEIAKLPPLTPPTRRTPTVRAKLIPNQADLKTFITIKLNDHYQRIQRGEDAIPEELSLAAYLNYTVENDLLNTYDFSGQNQALLNYALNKLDASTQALEEELEEEMTEQETIPVITSPVIRPPVATAALPAPRPQRMETPQAESFDADELSSTDTSPMATTNHPGFGSLAPRLSPTTTSLQPSSTGAEFSLDNSPTMDKKTPTTELLLNFIHNQIAEKRSKIPDLETLSQVIENEIIQTFDFSGAQAKQQRLDEFALQELDLAINDLMFEEDQPTNIPPAATTDLTFWSQPNVATQAYPSRISHPIPISQKRAIATTTNYEPHSFKDRQSPEDEFTQQTQVYTMPQYDTIAEQALNLEAISILVKNPTISPSDLEEQLINFANNNGIDQFESVTMIDAILNRKDFVETQLKNARKEIIQNNPRTSNAELERKLYEYATSQNLPLDTITKNAIKQLIPLLDPSEF